MNTVPKEFNPPRVQCKVCGTILQSNYYGEFVMCKCPRESSIFVDQTELYSRYGGNPQQFIWLDKQEEKEV